MASCSSSSGVGTAEAYGPRSLRYRAVSCQGELEGQTKALYDSRQQVMHRLVGEAEQRGSDAIVGMRFDTSEIGNGWTEICAYGTAVTVTPAT